MTDKVEPRAEFKRQIDGVWAVEPGMQITFERLSNGWVVIQITEDYGTPQAYIRAVATMEDYRWQRIVKAMEPQNRAKGQETDDAGRT